MNTISLLSAIVVLPPLSGLLVTLISNLKSVRSEIPGLLFHSVLPSPKLNMSHIHIDTFKSFLGKLEDKNFKAITLNNANKSQANKKCLITFDDGFECVYRYALPLLEQFKQKMTVFCVSEFCNINSSWDIFSNQPHLSVSQIKEISDLGHEIGSHTATHANLPFLNERDLRLELADSKHKLEDITGKEVSSISFPFGGWNQRIWHTALALGYKSSTLYRNHSLKNSEQYPVYGVYRFDSAESIIKRVSPPSILSHSHTIATLMSHFSKGSPIWKFQKRYTKI